jgi:hypothetical protein
LLARPLTVPEVAGLLGLGENEVREFARKGRLRLSEPLSSPLVDREGFAGRGILASCLPDFVRRADGELAWHLAGVRYFNRLVLRQIETLARPGRWLRHERVVERVREGLRAQRPLPPLAQSPDLSDRVRRLLDVVGLLQYDGWYAIEAYFVPLDVVALLEGTGPTQTGAPASRSGTRRSAKQARANLRLVPGARR